MTLGFRGEALAAIASVCSLTIISKTKESETASMLTSEAGEVIDVSEVGAADGTTVVVENLFYNVPARRKFLKKDSTEAMNVTALVEKVALSRPDISIQLLIDGEEKFKTPGNSSLLDTIASVFGREFSKKMIKAEGEANGVKVSGYIGRSDNVKKNRNAENVFINGRYVKSLTAMAAIEKAYTSYIAPECFPCCVLFLSMSPAAVDVNVHPAKLEVKFSDERMIFEAVYYTVKRAIEEYEYRPEMILPQKNGRATSALSRFVPIGEDTKGKQISMRSDFSSVKIDEAPIKKPSLQDYPEKKAETPKSRHDDAILERPLNFASGTGERGFCSTPSGVSMTPKDSIELLERYRNASKTEPQHVDTPRREETKRQVPETLPEVEYKILGEAFDCYIIVETEGALLLIDKHAAHERVIFEDLKKTREGDGRVGSQQLLLPICAILSPEEISAVSECRDEILSLGFDFTLNNKSADIVAIPDAISANDAEALFVKIADEIVEGRGNPTVTDAIRKEKALYQIACKAAIKGGRVYDKTVIEWLVRKVLTIPDITVCPHGRPIAYRLTKNELDRQFDRIK
jgi:DNA mismatch repair protein MutL